MDTKHKVQLRLDGRGDDSSPGEHEHLMASHPPADRRLKILKSNHTAYVRPSDTDALLLCAGSQGAGSHLSSDWACMNSDVEQYFLLTEVHKRKQKAFSAVSF